MTPTYKQIPTPQQRAVTEFVRTDTRHGAVNAVAGSGKTTTLVRACAVAGPRAGFAAFNSHIKDELRRRLDGTAEALTLHSLGLRTLTRAFPGIATEDKRGAKVGRHLERLYPQFYQDGRGKWKGRKYLREEWASVPRVVGVCRQLNVSPGEGRAAVEAACWRQDVDLPGGPRRGVVMDAADRVLAELLDDRAACDFDDMVWMPVRLGLVRPQFATLFVDEAQDLNPAQQSLALASGDRLVVVGDPRQSVMGFAGADVRGFYTLCDRLAGTPRGLLELPLSCCFRCPESHLRLARLLVPHIEPGAFPDEGVVREAPPAELVAAAAPGDRVLCRNTAPLMRLAFRLIGAGKPTRVRGRAVGDDLRRLVGQLAAATVPDLIYRLSAWKADQLERLDADDAPPEARERVADRADSLRAVADSVANMGDLEAAMAGLFDDADDARAVCLSTVHRAKGLEADRVWLYEPGLMPGGRAAPDEQELNLLYVALTRARRELVFVDDRVRRNRGIVPWVEAVAGGAHRFDVTEKPPRAGVG